MQIELNPNYASVVQVKKHSLSALVFVTLFFKPHDFLCVYTVSQYISTQKHFVFF